MSSSIQQKLADILQRRITSQALEWFGSTRDLLIRAASQSVILRAYTSASRQVGKARLKLSAAERADLAAHAGQLAFERWHSDDAARAVFLLDIQDSAGDAYGKFVCACYEQGDSSEQTSWLRGLNLVPSRCDYLPMAIDSCRTNILPMFEAIACENPYPSLFFPDLNFNQLVLKSLFNGISLSRIVGLETRLNDDLARMADDYASEREAAGRAVPVDIWYVIAPRIQDQGLERVRRYLNHDNPEHRHWAAAGLSLRKG